MNYIKQNSVEITMIFLSTLVNMDTSSLLGFVEQENFGRVLFRKTSSLPQCYIHTKNVLQEDM